MENDAEPAAQAERKAQLLLIGETYRIGILQGQMTVIRNLQAKSLLQSAVEHALGFAGNRLGSALAPAGGGGLKSLVPFAVASFSYLSGKRLIKPAIGVGLLAATALILFWRHNHIKAAERESLPPTE